jgi:hypothetical protein
VRGGCGWRILRDNLGVGCVCMYVGISRFDVYMVVVILLVVVIFFKVCRYFI